MHILLIAPSFPPELCGVGDHTARMGRELSRLGARVDLLIAQPGRLIIRSARKPRAGWAAEAKSMHKAGEDGLLDAPAPSRFDETEWSW